MELNLAVFFDTNAHRNAAALALKSRFAGHARMMGAVEDFGVSGGGATGYEPQLWASLEFDADVYAARLDGIQTLIRNNAAAYGVTNVGVNGLLVQL